MLKKWAFAGRSPTYEQQDPASGSGNGVADSPFSRNSGGFRKVAARFRCCLTGKNNASFRVRKLFLLGSKNFRLWITPRESVCAQAVDAFCTNRFWRPSQKVVHVHAAVNSRLSRVKTSLQVIDLVEHLMVVPLIHRHLLSVCYLYR